MFCLHYIFLEQVQITTAILKRAIKQVLLEYGGPRTSIWTKGIIEDALMFTNAISLNEFLCMKMLVKLMLKLIPLIRNDFLKALLNNN